MQLDADTADLLLCVQTHRKRRSTLVSRTSTKTSREANPRTTASRTANVGDDSAPPSETIDVMDNSEDGRYRSMFTTD